MNIRKRRQCANYGVTFVNADQAWDKKQIVVQYQTERPLFAVLFWCIYCCDAYFCRRINRD